MKFKDDRIELKDRRVIYCLQRQFETDYLQKAEVKYCIKINTKISRKQLKQCFYSCKKLPPGGTPGIDGLFIDLTEKTIYVVHLASYWEFLPDKQSYRMQFAVPKSRLMPVYYKRRLNREIKAVQEVAHGRIPVDKNSPAWQQAIAELLKKCILNPEYHIVYTIIDMNMTKEQMDKSKLYDRYRKALKKALENSIPDLVKVQYFNIDDFYSHLESEIEMGREGKRYDTKDNPFFVPNKPESNGSAADNQSADAEPTTENPKKEETTPITEMEGTNYDASSDYAPEEPDEEPPFADVIN